MLSISDREYFKKAIEQSLQDIAKPGGNRYSDIDSTVNADPVDRASDELNATLLFRFKERNSNLARKLQRALDKISEGTFGVCEECGHNISLKRLQVRPIAELCIKCKEKQERFEKIYGT